mmetsp:Transcript_17914/g.30469  ORF Transcript_17914/g.30469 Transcript_17914/m.30469 type:complete len:104 (+) Transcript_17914:702-1013(+)
MGIRSFGLTPENQELNQIEDQASSVQPMFTYNSFFKKIIEVTPTQCIRASLQKCTSGLHFGAFQHELLGIFLTNVMDLLPLEQRMLITRGMGKQFNEHFGKKA